MGGGGGGGGGARSGCYDSREGHGAMPSAETHLDRWQKARLLDAAQVERILAFERAEAERERREDAERPGLLEAVLYLGIAVGSVGVVTLTAQNWDDLETWARIAVLAVPGLLLLLAGVAMRTQEQPAIARASGVAWLACIALLAGAAAVAAHEADWEDRRVLLAAGLTATALALALWVVHPRHPQVVALAGSLVVLAVAVGAWADENEELVAGLMIALFALVGIALTELRLFGPWTSAALLGAAGVMAGLFIAAYPAGERLWAELLLFLAGAGLIALGLRRSAFVYIVVAVIGLFAGLVAFIFRHFEDELGAPLALMLTGALVIAAALLLAHFRSRLRRQPVT